MKGISLFLLAFVVVARAQLDECPAEQEINWEIEWLLRHEDCHKFYKCTLGQPVEFTCPSDLYFNLDTWKCDYQFNVDCNGRNDPALTTTIAPTAEPSEPIPTTPVPTTTTTTTTTTPIPTTTTTTTTTTPAPTTTTTTTTTTPAPTTTTTTTTPTPTTTTTTTTPAPTTTTTTTTPAPTTTTSTSTTTESPECEIEISPEGDGGEDGGEEEDEEEEVELDFLPNGCPVDPHVHWLLPNEEDCTLFYYCVWGEKVLRECPASLHFNPNLQVCDWPQAAGCTVSVNKHAEARRSLLKQIML